VNRAKHRADMGRLSQEACYFPVSWMSVAKGQDVTSWTLVMEWVYLLAVAQEGASVGCDFRSDETLV
jgi:hypothetical protein